MAKTFDICTHHYYFNVQSCKLFGRIGYRIKNEMLQIPVSLKLYPLFYFDFFQLKKSQYIISLFVKLIAAIYWSLVS